MFHTKAFSEIWKKRFAFIAITFLFCANHFLLLFNRHVYWDGILWNHLITANDFETLTWVFKQTGQGIIYWIFRFLELFPKPLIASKFVSFFSLLGATLFFTKFLTRLRLVDLNAAFVAGLVASSLATYGLSTELCLIHYHVCLLLFFAGNDLIMKYFNDAQPVGLFFCGLILATLSYNMGSLLFLQIALLPLYVLNAGDIKSKISKLILLTVSPLVFYIFSTKPSGLYVDYNGLRSDLQPVLRTSLTIGFSFIKSSLIFRLAELRANGFSVPVFFGITFAVGLTFFIINSQATRKTKFGPVWMMAAFVPACFAAVFPYIMVNKYPDLGDWGQRHGIVLSFTFPIAIASIHGLARRSKVGHAISATVISAFLALAAAWNNLNYEKWNSDGVKYDQMGLAAQANQSALAECTDIFGIDETGVGNRFGRSYRDYEWAGILIKANPLKEDKLFAMNKKELDGIVSRMVQFEKSDHKDFRLYKRFSMARDYDGTQSQRKICAARFTATATGLSEKFKMVVEPLKREPG